MLPQVFKHHLGLTQFQSSHFDDGHDADGRRRHVRLAAGSVGEAAAVRVEAFGDEVGDRFFLLRLASEIFQGA